VTTKEDMWELASVIAFERLGLLPLRKIDGVMQPPGDAFATMSPDTARRMKRKYRKLWRRDLVRDLRDFAKAAPRRRKHWRYTGTYVDGKWKCVEDPLLGMMLKIQALDVGRRPRWAARGYRWERVLQSKEYNKMLLKVAAELGLLDPLRSM